MSRKICITAVDGQTGALIAELLLTDGNLSNKLVKIYGLSLTPKSTKCAELSKLGVEIISYTLGKEWNAVSMLKSTGVDTICLIPPAHQNKFVITRELVMATKKANIPNVLCITSAGADLAMQDKQPRLREFVEIEHLVMAAKSDTGTQTVMSNVCIRPAYYMENLLLYLPQVKNEKMIPLPIGLKNKFPPIALGDVALAAAHILTGTGEDGGFDPKHRDQIAVFTGPDLVSGKELADAANKALGVKLTFEDISFHEARNTLIKQAGTDISEIEYLLEYYSLVNEGKTNYVSTLGFRDITGQEPEGLCGFFKSYADEFKTK